MSEQTGTQSSTKQRKSRKTNTANQENGKQVLVAQRPAKDDKEAWKDYWKEQGQLWRTEPEIDEERQKILAERLAIKPDIQQGRYPFKEFKLTRADLEWLLATHENGHGPVDWSDESQRDRDGLDLRGADLSRSDLRNLPLARTLGGLTSVDWGRWSEEQRNMATISLKEAFLYETRLQGAHLRGAHLQGAYLTGAHLEGADLRKARMGEVHLYAAHLEQTDLRRVHLERADLRKAHLERADLRGAQLQGADLEGITWEDEMHASPQIADAEWSEVNLTIVNWSSLKVLGDEQQARQLQDRDNQINEYQAAVRANRQLAVALQNQGMNEDAARFAYRAQLCQRVVFRRQNKFGRYLFSLLLDLLAGYGFRPGRSVIWYLVMIFGFALAYFTFGHLPFFPDAFVFSLTSFHGRGFFPGLGSENSLHNPLVVIAAFEAVIGLLIEISFIATFTQRFFGK